MRDGSRPCLRGLGLQRVGLFTRSSRPRRAGISLVVVIDLYSHRVVGLATDRRMKKTLVIRALMMLINIRNTPAGLIHHPDRGSQYASHDYHALLKQHGVL